MQARIASVFLRLGLPLFTIALITAACGEEVSIPPPADPEDSGGAGGDGSTTDANNPTDGGGTSDVADVACPILAPDDSIGVFVAPTGSVGASCGTRAEPCKTLAGGIARASAVARTKIFVARGVYAERTAVRAGMRIEGAWDILPSGAWNRVCVDPSNAVTLRSPPGQNVTVFAKDLGGKSELALLRIESKQQNQIDRGESVYGVFAAGATTTVALEDVVVDLNNGGNGKDGALGIAGIDAAAAGTCASGAGTAGTKGTSGVGAFPGTFDATGYVTKDGAAGGASTAGQGGTAGAAATCVQCGTCAPFPACTFIPQGAQTCGSDGKSGCGGGGGGPGTPGQGGGSSIGVFAWDATVSITGGRVRAGDGGNGGNGGNGGGPKAGSVGAAGMQSELCTIACAANGNACVETKGRGLAGGAGGAGGTGGIGATGGGGAGGSSFAIFQGGAGVVSAPSTVTLVFGKAGKGGGPDPGSATGAAGGAAARFP